MKNITVLLCSLLFVNLILAQEQALKISSPTAEKQVLIKEHKRVKIRTAEGEKISGRLRIVDAHSIAVGDTQIQLVDIKEIKRNPLLLSLFSSGFLIYAGAITAGMGVIIGLFVESSGFLLAIPGAALIFAGIKSPNVLKNYKAENNWNFKLISISEHP
ncbi:MAG: hypothetical protein R3252_03555 [Robiginitalea sp.]|nr:hypothetical protein [Robiginitalea sp.]